MRRHIGDALAPDIDGAAVAQASEVLVTRPQHDGLSNPSCRRLAKSISKAQQVRRDRGPARGAATWSGLQDRGDAVGERRLLVRLLDQGKLAGDALLHQRLMAVAG